MAGRALTLAPVRRRAVPRRAAVPCLSVVIVNYGQWENTAALVKQILRTPTARRGAVEVVVVDNHSPPHPLAARLRRWPGVSLRRWRVPWVTGCCLLLRRECVRDLGGLDEAFFLYYEDVDLCRRARAKGWSVWYEPDLRAVHHDPLHARAVPPALRLITRHALLTYAQRHWPAWQLGLLAGVVRLEAAARRLWARWRGDARAAAIFAELGGVAGDLWGGRPAEARRRLERVVRA